MPVCIRTLDHCCRRYTITALPRHHCPTTPARYGPGAPLHVPLNTPYTAAAVPVAVKSSPLAMTLFYPAANPIAIPFVIVIVVVAIQNTHYTTTVRRSGGGGDGTRPLPPPPYPPVNAFAYATALLPLFRPTHPTLPLSSSLPPFRHDHSVPYAAVPSLRTTM